MRCAIANGVDVGKLDGDLANRMVRSLAEARDAGHTVEEWFAAACDLGWMVLRVRRASPQSASKNETPVAMPTVQPALF